MNRRPESVLAAIEEAVHLRRRLVAARPEVFNPNLAGSLNNLSASLADLGRRERPKKPPGKPPESRMYCVPDLPEVMP